MEATKATYLDVRNYLTSIDFNATNDDIYDFLEWVILYIFDDESLEGAWRRYNSTDFQGDCV